MRGFSSGSEVPNPLLWLMTLSNPVIAFFPTACLQPTRREQRHAGHGEFGVFEEVRVELVGSRRRPAVCCSSNTPLWIVPFRGKGKVGGTSAALERGRMYLCLLLLEFAFGVVFPIADAPYHDGWGVEGFVETELECECGGHVRRR